MQDQNEGNLPWKLFITMLTVSSVTFGGGFVIAAWMKKKIVEERHWLEEKEMLDLIALAQSCPGAIAVNTAVLAGWRIAGPTGMLAAAGGTILPPMIILSVLSYFYDIFVSDAGLSFFLRGTQAAAAAVILDASVSLAGYILKEKSLLQILLMTGAFLGVCLFGIHEIQIIFTALLIGIFLFFAERGKIQ